MFPIGYEDGANVSQSDFPISDMAALAQLARAARLAQGMTRDDLANATGLSPKFISHFEAAKPTAQIGKVLRSSWNSASCCAQLLPSRFHRISP